MSDFGGLHYLIVLWFLQVIIFFMSLVVCFFT